MADFVAVIRKAVDSLSENTPENRTKVYDKARAAIRRQLEAINPQPSDEVIARQLDKLDLAIEEVESEHAEALPADLDEADALMAELESMVEKSPVIVEPASPPQMAAPIPAPSPAPQPAPEPEAVAASPQPASRPSDLVGDAHDEAFGLGHAPDKPERASRARQPVRGKGGKSGIAVLALVVLLAAVAYAGWVYKDSVIAMFGSGTTDTPVATETAQPAAETAAVTPEPAAQPATPEPAAPVAELTDAGAVDESAAEEGTAEAPVSPQDATAPASQPLGVAQKMILYEERLGQQSLDVNQGTVVWTLVSEPSGDGPDEQVIRGEINNPEKGLSALITIKRNTDPSLPASHIIEVVFAVPTDFDGGSIDQLQRIAMKQTEADQGNPLIAVPAKITQDFYMVALNDLGEARDANVEMLRQRNWIDIPVVYANGRQALITLEKGTSGTEVFNQALDAWAKAAPVQ